MKLILLMLTLMVFSSCKEVEKKEAANIDDEISVLKNNDQKTLYLEMILNVDQSIRDGKSSEIMLEHGQNSREYQEFIDEMDSIDDLNFKRIDQYLKTFGYPDKDSVTDYALDAPWLVIHHNLNNSKRKKHFSRLHKAYKEGNINSEQFDLYLSRTYNIEFSDYPRWEGAYKPDDKIKWMIKELDLQ